MGLRRLRKKTCVSIAAFTITGITTHVQAQVAWTVGGVNGVFKTYDWGATWQRQNPATSATLFSVTALSEPQRCISSWFT